MMSTIDVVARAVARSQNEVVRLRSTSSIAPDDGEPFAIALIRMVAEEQVQALAFGNPAGAPTIAIRWNPLSRDASDLEPFAAALDSYIAKQLQLGKLPRFWIPHPAALSAIEILSHRYRTNKEASQTLRRMGAQCRIIVDEVSRPGQQTVVVATKLLTEHVATGQMPIEDRHLDALLAWVERDVRDRVQEAERRSLAPAAAMLPRTDDDRVEELRPVAKDSTARAARARGEIGEILQRGVRREWEMLIRARSEFSRLGFPQNPEIGELVTRSRERMKFAFENLASPPSRPSALSSLLNDMEFESELLAETDSKNDSLVRERLRRSGRSISARVERVVQPTPNQNPCRVVIATTQKVLRIRRGTSLQTVDGDVEGKVQTIQPISGGQQIDLVLTKGVRTGVVPRAGDEGEWVEAGPPNLKFTKGRAKRAARTSGAFTLDSDAPLPPKQIRRVRSRDLLAKAVAARRS